jgi:glyceraldehyde 3-phosphate dehydrogenase
LIRSGAYDTYSNRGNTMAARIGINGFGRIGRLVLRAMMKKGSDLDLVAVNDVTDPATLAHLLKYDSVHGRLEGEVAVKDGAITVDGRSIKVLSEREPAKLPWKEFGVDIVLEATGIFRSREQAGLHLDAGAKKVVISAPGKNEDITIVMGVNDDRYDATKHHVISNASCTTNCLVPVVKVIMDSFGFERGFMTTIHSYTNDQRILDLPHKDLRRARAAALSMIPTTTGAARATGLVIPEVKGKIDGVALRVPTADVSMVDLTCNVSKPTDTESVNAAFRAAAAGALQGTLAVSDEPLVSVDYIGNMYSSTVDALSTNVIDGTLVHVSSWYDNEMGYSARCIDLMELIAGSL